MFTTEDLIKGLKARTELFQNSLKGLTDYERIQSLCLEYGLYLERLQEFQQQNKISGLQKRSLRIGNETLDFHESHYQLMTLDSDLEVLKSEKDRVIDFFLNVEFDDYVKLSACFIPNHNETEYLYISEGMIKQICCDADYSKLSYTFTGNGDSYQPTLRLVAGWGKPENTVYKDDTGTDKIFFRFKGDTEQE